MKKAYPSAKQSLGITGLILFCMILFAPLNIYLNGITSKSISTLIYYVFSLTTPFIIFHFLKKKEEGQVNYGFQPKSFVVVILLTLATLALQWGIISPITELIPMPEFLRELFEQLAKELNDVYGLITVAIAAPILEELLFRGIILDGLLKRRSVISSILISSFLFAIVHLNPWQFTAAMILGSFAGWVYYRTRNLIYSIIIHFVNNFSASIFIFLFPEMAGMTEDTSALVGGTENMFLITAGAVLLAAACIYYLNRILKQEKEIHLSMNESANIIQSSEES